MNESKVRDMRFWEKWKAVGAIGNMLSAETEPIRKEAKAIEAMVVFYDDPRGIHTTLCIGERVVNEGDDWRVTEPELYVVVPGENFKLGQQIKAEDLPSGTQTIKEFSASEK